jgi:hypothetical protein
MKIQIKRFSPHQNAKVVAVFMALSSLVFVVPMSLAFYFSPMLDKEGNPVGLPAVMYLLFPIMYLVMGYVTAVIGCALYNFVCKYTGGIEFETSAEEG